MDERTADNLELVGGWICLDFANTATARDEALRRLRREYLPTYGQLVAWSRHAGLLAEVETKALLKTAACHPALAAAVLDCAIALRETIYRIFTAIAQAREPDSRDLATTNAVLHAALSRLQVIPSAGGFQWAWVEGEGDLDRMLWPIVRSAADLLISADLRRVRQCAGEGCDWLFVDTSKNQSRRWCSMNMCGSRDKARRYYRRRKTQKR